MCILFYHRYSEDTFDDDASVLSDEGTGLLRRFVSKPRSSVDRTADAPSNGRGSRRRSNPMHDDNLSYVRPTKHNASREHSVSSDDVTPKRCGSKYSHGVPEDLISDTHRSHNKSYHSEQQRSRPHVSPRSDTKFRGRNENVNLPNKYTQHSGHSVLQGRSHYLNDTDDVSSDSLSAFELDEDSFQLQTRQHSPVDSDPKSIDQHVTTQGNMERTIQNDQVRRRNHRHSKAFNGTRSSGHKENITSTDALRSAQTQKTTRHFSVRSPGVQKDRHSTEENLSARKLSSTNHQSRIFRHSQRSDSSATSLPVGTKHKIHEHVSVTDDSGTPSVLHALKSTIGKSNDEIDHDLMKDEEVDTLSETVETNDTLTKLELERAKLLRELSLLNDGMKAKPTLDTPVRNLKRSLSKIHRSTNDSSASKTKYVLFCMSSSSCVLFS